MRSGSTCHERPAAATNVSDPADRAAGALAGTLVWDWPLRLWHWVFALVVTGSLVTGLMGDISLMDWHMRLGYGALGLLLFRLGWALWGGRYARLSSFRVSPGRFVAHFRGSGESAPRSAPGVLLTLALVLVVALQAVTGLYTTDDIFTDGPLVRHASRDTIAVMSAIHHRAYWAALGLIALHLLAHAIYGLRRDPTPLSMFTGRKPVAVVPTRNLILRGLLTAAAAAAAVWWGLSAV
jgi:cytochrome b